jgi:hypothetical protein
MPEQHISATVLMREPGPAPFTERHLLYMAPTLSLAGLDGAGIGV